MNWKGIAETTAATTSITSWFHNIDYAIILCRCKVEVSCFCKVGMAHSPALKDAWEIAGGIDSDERARCARDRGFVESHG